MLAKVELHVHLEGTIRPELVYKLAQRNGLEHLSEKIFNDNGGYRWENFLDFLNVYELASGVIRTAEDYRDLTYDYLAQCAQQDTIYVELLASPEHVALHGMSYPEFLEGISQGIYEAKRDFGIESRILVAMVRHYGIEKCLAVVETAIQNPHTLVVGVGLGGDEVGFPPAQFAAAYQLAQQHGLGCTAHAGEWVGPVGIREALDHLPVDRIGHGVRAIEDPELVKRLADSGIVLECSPGSNIALGVYADYAQHPLRQLYEAGVKVTLNADDPPFFNTSIGQEYQIAKEHLGFSDQELVELTDNAINAAYIDADLKQALKQKAAAMAQQIIS